MSSANHLPGLAPRRATSPRVRIDLFDYELPQDRIATHPPPRRDGARLMRIDPRRGTFEDRTIADLPELVPPGSLVVVNDTRVLRARLLGAKVATGGKVEIFLVEKLSGEARCERWRALGRASKGLGPGTMVRIEGGELLVRIEARSEHDGSIEVTLFSEGGLDVAQAIERFGRVPLPPYMRREPSPEDVERYQTVFAEKPGAVAAPTAGLHLTPELLGALRERDVEIATLTLHVGLGTFQPVTVDDLDAHPMHSERFEISPSLVEAIAAARRRERPVMAIGTTVVRALESAACPEQPGHVRAMTGETRLLIQPGYRFRVVDALLTNFHLPRSTLLALVCAFAGRECVLEAYREAVRRGYRFYSYGDAMLIPSRVVSETP